MTRCIAPMCEERAVQQHHCVYQQELRRRWQSEVRHWKDDRALVRVPWASLAELRGDGRNLIPMCLKHHASHHNRFAVLPAATLPFGVFEFAEELMGPGAAFEYLRRTYRGDDPRLDYLKGRAG